MQVSELLAFPQTDSTLSAVAESERQRGSIVSERPRVIAVTLHAANFKGSGPDDR